MKPITPLALPLFSEAILFGSLYAVVAWQVMPMLKRVYVDTGRSLTGLSGVLFAVSPWSLVLTGCMIGALVSMARMRPAWRRAWVFGLLGYAMLSTAVLLGLALPALT
jgi:hypothetical protein